VSNGAEAGVRGEGWTEEGAGSGPRRLYILCWREHSRRKLSPTLAAPTTLALTTLVAQCELSRRQIGLLLEVVGRKFSHRPGNPAAVRVVRWPAVGDTAGSSLRRLSSLQHRIYNLLGQGPHLIHGSLGPVESTFQTASGSVQPCWHSSRSCPADRRMAMRTSSSVGDVTVHRVTLYA